MFERGKVLLGITPTGWTNDDQPLLGDDIPFEQTISEIALAGFEGCSIGHKFPTNTGELRDALELRGLRVSEPWVSTYFTARGMERQTEERFLQQLAFIQELGGTDIVVAELGGAVHQQPVAVLPNRPPFTDANWKAVVDGLHRLGKLAADSGMRLCYHHHIGTGIQQRSEVDRLLASTDPELVHLLYDTGHCAYAGEDPLDLIETHAARVKHVHLKNIRQPVLEESIALGRSFLKSVEAGVFTVPGDTEGAIDFRPILAVLEEVAYEGWLVVEAEQDPAMANPLRYAKMARAYLAEVAGL